MHAETSFTSGIPGRMNRNRIRRRLVGRNGTTSQVKGVTGLSLRMRGEETGDGPAF
jgi:hypothetical protein